MSYPASSLGNDRSQGIPSACDCPRTAIAFVFPVCSQPGDDGARRSWTERMIQTGNQGDFERTCRQPGGHAPVGAPGTPMARTVHPSPGRHKFIYFIG
jgi:hypothetical protein